MLDFRTSAAANDQGQQLILRGYHPSVDHLLALVVKSSVLGGNVAHLPVIWSDVALETVSTRDWLPSYTQ